MRRLALIVLFLSAVGGIHAPSQVNRGSIGGIVVNKRGQFVEKATVYADVLGNRPYIGLIPQGETDETGHFAIQGLEWGQYAVSAKKEEEDYPEMRQAFYSGGTMLTVMLRPPDANVTVTIRLGPKAGVLVGAVRDAVTGDPLNPCVRLTRVSDPNLFIEGTGLVNHVYRLLIPSNTDVMMEVWLEGYKTWHYTRSKHRSTIKSVRLEPGEDQRLDIQLEPDSNVNQGSCGMPVGTVVPK
jgi:hypothetical protein